MIKLDETNYIDLSLDKVTLEQRREICRQFNYKAYCPEFYMILFKHDESYLNGSIYDSYTSNNRLYPNRLHFLIGRKEIRFNNLGSM